jgi:hypothetical protein
MADKDKFPKVIYYNPDCQNVYEDPLTEEAPYVDDGEEVGEYHLVKTGHVSNSPEFIADQPEKPTRKYTKRKASKNGSTA